MAEVGADFCPATAAERPEAAPPPPSQGPGGANSGMCQFGYWQILRKESLLPVLGCHPGCLGGKAVPLRSGPKSGWKTSLGRAHRGQNQGRLLENLTSGRRGAMTGLKEEDGGLGPLQLPAPQDRDHRRPLAQPCPSESSPL